MSAESAGATLDDVRRSNLAQVMKIAHQSGPVSRADLARAMGMSRSTIAALVADLQERGLVTETHGVAKRVGRPSLVVTAAPSTAAIAINPEVDATHVAIVTLGGRVVRRVRHRNERVPTPGEFLNAVTAILDGMRPELEARYRILGVGVAVPGLVRAGDGTVLLARHLGWNDVPLASELSAAIDLPVYAANDGNCGLMGEAVFGAGRGIGTTVLLNGGPSGIGGAIAVGGGVLGGHTGHSGEFGHTLVESAGQPCHCGAVGCLETEVRRDRLLEAVRLDSSRIDELLPALTRAWRDPETAGYKEMRRQVRYLGVALRGIVNGLNPHCVVLGGFLGTLLKVVGEAEIKRALGDTLPGGAEDMILRHAALGDEILLVGAAEMVFQPVIDDPTRVASQPGIARMSSPA